MSLLGCRRHKGRGQRDMRRSLFGGGAVWAGPWLPSPPATVLRHSDSEERFRAISYATRSAAAMEGVAVRLLRGRALVSTLMASVRPVWDDLHRSGGVFS